jgi:formylmethanofuran dehydrogenase subunit C
MSSFRLTLTARPAQPVDLSPLVPQRLAGMTRSEIGALELATGNRRLRVDELFSIAGDPGPALEIRDSCDMLHGLGAGMTQGDIVVRGDVGAYLGAGMTGGTLTVHGNAGAFAASGIRDGMIRITGDAGDFLGAARPGDHQGMRGGVVLVGGNAGDRAGDRMRRGMLLIEGSAGDYCASRMVAGTLAVWGAVGRFPGLAMRRGTLLLQRPPAALPPTFNESGTFPFTFLTLLARSWRTLPAPFGTLAETGLQVQRFMGDLANDGRGEILILARAARSRGKASKA